MCMCVRVLDLVFEGVGVAVGKCSNCCFSELPYIFLCYHNTDLSQSFYINQTVVLGV